MPPGVQQAPLQAWPLSGQHDLHLMPPPGPHLGAQLGSLGGEQLGQQIAAHSDLLGRQLGASLDPATYTNLLRALTQQYDLLQQQLAAAQAEARRLAAFGLPAAGQPAVGRPAAGPPNDRPGPFAGLRLGAHGGRCFHEHAGVGTHMLQCD